MLTGGCLCGRVRYETEAEPFHQTTCHCGSCRRAVGAASVAWFSVRRDTLRWPGAEPASYASSPGVLRRFCATCGTSLTFQEARHPDEIDITIASLDDPAAMKPRDHTEVSGKLPWLPLCDGLPAYEKGRPGRG